MSAITLHINSKDKLPDLKGWTNRFEIRSATSDRVYVVAQNIEKRYMGCSCPGWRIHRTCKHLKALGLPGHEQPVTLNIN
jgi:hypothetical protein